MVPVGVTVDILPFVNAGCMNTQGRVVKSCLELCCTETGEEFICSKALVRYMVENCHQCEIIETWFCDKDLVVLTVPAP